MKALFYSLVAIAICVTAQSCSKDAKDVKSSQVNTLDPEGVTRRSAICGGDVIDDGGGTITERGVCYSSSGEPTISDKKVISSGTTGKFNVELQGLTMNLVYYCKAYSINEAGVSYGNVKSFATLPVPEVTISSLDNMTMTGCRCIGTITLDYPILEAGFCIGLAENPSTADNYIKIYDYTPFSVEVGGLQPGTVYHVRAYAKNQFGNAYSNDLAFTTLENDLPVVETLQITQYSLNSVSIQGEVVNECGPGTIRGIIWGTNNQITLDNAQGITENGSGKGVFEGIMEGTQCNVIYYAKAYAKNARGVSYGYPLQVRYDLPHVSLIAVDDIGGDKVTCLAEVTSDGYIGLITSGYCWSTNANPDVDDNCTNSLEISPTGLTQSTVYYIRAFAQNQVGITYSNEKSFNSGFSYGTQMEGGLVFYNDGIGHGLVSLSDVLPGQGKLWGCQGTLIGTSDLIDASQANTTAIATKCDSEPEYCAAKFVDQFVSGGYSDWALPSKRAMELIHYNLIVPGFFGGSKTMTNYIWSSTEVDAHSAYAYHNGMWYNEIKYHNNYMVPVRSF